MEFTRSFLLAVRRYLEYGADDLRRGSWSRSFTSAEYVLLPEPESIGLRCDVRLAESLILTVVARLDA